MVKASCLSESECRFISFLSLIIDPEKLSSDTKRENAEISMRMNGRILIVGVEVARL